LATNLTTIFGNEICVYAQPRLADRQHVGFPGAHGLVSTNMGTRGRQLIVSGMLASSGANYQAARANLQDVIDSIEEYFYPDIGPAEYGYAGETYDHVIFEKFQLIPDASGKAFHWTAGGYATCRFVCYLRQLI